MANVSELKFQNIPQGGTTYIFINVDDIQKFTSRRLEVDSSSNVIELLKLCFESFPEYRGEFILRSGPKSIGSKSIPLKKKIKDVWKETDKIPKVVLISSAEAIKKNINTIYTASVLLSFNDKLPINLYGKCPINKIRIGRGTEYVKKKDQTKNNHYNNLLIIRTPYGNYLVNIYCFYNQISGEMMSVNQRFDVKLTFDNSKSFIIPIREHYKDKLDIYMKNINIINPTKRAFQMLYLDLYRSETISNGIKRFFGIGNYKVST